MPFKFQSVLPDFGICGRACWFSLLYSTGKNKEDGTTTVCAFGLGAARGGMEGMKANLQFCWRAPKA